MCTLNVPSHKLFKRNSGLPVIRTRSRDVMHHLILCPIPTFPGLFVLSDKLKLSGTDKYLAILRYNSTRVTACQVSAADIIPLCHIPVGYDTGNFKVQHFTTFQIYTKFKAKSFREMENATELKDYRGNCHCGLFKFKIKIPTLKTVWSCNCSICSRVFTSSYPH